MIVRSMLAYVFWHWPRRGIDSAAYEATQRRFHAALGTEPPPGFLSSRSVAIAGAPWAAGGGAAYEDWYLTGGSAALDPLDHAAVTAGRQQPHAEAAAAAADGTAGLYRLRRGEDDAAAGWSVWFAKPAGMSYAGLYQLLEPLVTAERAALWGRQMVLGPTPEFCLHARRTPKLPAGLQGLVLARRLVWPG